MGEKHREREREEDVRREGVRVQRRHDCMLLWIDGGGVEERGCTNDVLRISRAKAKKKRKKKGSVGKRQNTARIAYCH